MVVTEFIPGERLVIEEKESLLSASVVGILLIYQLLALPMICAAVASYFNGRPLPAWVLTACPYYVGAGLFFALLVAPRRLIFAPDPEGRGCIIVERTI